MFPILQIGPAVIQTSKLLLTLGLFLGLGTGIRPGYSECFSVPSGQPAYSGSFTYFGTDSPGLMEHSPGPDSPQRSMHSIPRSGRIRV